MIKIPNKNQWVQTNTSDILGSIYASKNIDLTTNVGKVRLGQKLYINQSNSDVASLTSYPTGFRVFNNGTPQIWTVCGSSGTGYPFKNGSLNLTGLFAACTDMGIPSTCDSLCSDIEVFNNRLWFTADDNKAYYVDSSNTWGNISSFSVIGGAGTFNGMCQYLNRMYCMSQGTAITSWDTSYTIAPIGSAYTLQVTPNIGTAVITWIRAASNYIWIGTLSQNGGKGYVYRWDGISANYNTAYRLESAGALSCVIKDDVPYIMDTNGKLMAFNGGTFKEVGRLNRLSNKNLENPFYKSANRFIHPNGMSVINGNVCMLIDGSYFDAAKPSNSQDITIPSGIWEYTPTNGLYHKYSLGLTHSGDSPTDFGQTRILCPGGLSEIVSTQSPTITDGTFLAGASYYTDASTTNSAVWYNNRNDDGQKYGWLITPKIYSSTVTDTFEHAVARFRQFLNTTDKIVVKSRSIESDFTQISITWTSNTTFTTTTNISGMVGYEVEVVQGNGGGQCSHIVSVTGSGTYTVTVDETYSNCTSGTALARVQQWNKNGYYNLQKRSMFPFMTQAKQNSSTWIQYKICLQFTGRNELEDFLIFNQTNLKDVTN